VTRRGLCRLPWSRENGKFPARAGLYAVPAPHRIVMLAVYHLGYDANGGKD
jgi:hypothetical protein